MSQDVQNTPQARRSALYGFAQHTWSVEHARWELSLRWKPILSALLILFVAFYLTVAGAFYALNRWHRGCEDTSYREMLLFVFPDPIPGTKITWAPNFIKARVEAARESQRHKLSAVLFTRAKTAMENSDWRNFFHNIFGASKLDPRNVEARLLSAQAFFVLRRDDDAIDALEEPIPLLLDKPEYALQYIQACFNKEKEDRVIGMAKFVLAQPEASPAVRSTFAIALAMAHFRRGEFEMCSKVLESENLQRTPEGFTLTIDLMWETGRRAEAIRTLEPVALSQNAPPTFLAKLVEYKKSTGDIEGAISSASLYLIRYSDKFQARIKLIELLESPADKARRDEAIASYRRDFADKEPPTLLLCEFAADRGLVDLCGELMNLAKDKKFSDAPRFELLFIESHLKANRYEETVSLVDKIFIRDPEWLPKYRQVFDCLRMVAQMSMNREDMSEIGFRKLSDRGDTLPMPLMTTVAKKLVQVNRTEDAMRVVDLAYERNARSQTALTSVVDVHLAAGGGPITPVLLRRLIETRRPTTEMLTLARSTIAGDAFLFEPNRDKLIADIESLLDGKPIVADVPATVPKKLETREK